MIILDSNVWVSYLDKDDSQHKKAKKIFREISDIVVVPEYVIIEVCTVLLKKTCKETANNFIKIAFNNQNTEVLFFGEFIFNRFINNFKDIKNKKLSFIDTSLLYLSKSYQVVTFDKDLEKAIKKLNQKIC